MWRSLLAYLAVAGLLGLGIYTFAQHIRWQKPKEEEEEKPPEPTETKMAYDDDDFPIKPIKGRKRDVS